MDKICFKCGLTKPFSEYYKHAQMGDGYLGKCRTCTKKDSNDRYLRKEKDLNWVLSERLRRREKYRKSKFKINPTSKMAQPSKIYRTKFPLKYKAHTAVNHALKSGKLIAQPCCICGNIKAQAHHDSYLKENWLNVRWLCVTHHNEYHVKQREAELKLKLQCK